jgi:hypothetical protein
MKFVSLKYEDYNDVTSYITAFKSTIARLLKVMDKGDKVPVYWPAMLFVSGLERKFLV